MITITLALTTTYLLCLAYLFCYTLMQLDLFLIYLRSSRKGKSKSTSLIHYPPILIQLPIYNERYVVERLLNAVSALEYPKDLLYIQVLDDSTDDTSAIVEDWIGRHSKVSIQHIRRKSRKGFKAGALQHGLLLSSEPYVAIFDADFFPKKDFLLKTIPTLENNPGVGMVQGRWEHSNQDLHRLTKSQAFALNGHFSTEQSGRFHGGLFLNFNGTAGIWKRKCLEESGGWKDSTLTEDLELSYRAQLLGWKLAFQEDVAVPSELPVTMKAYKSQQYRWTKGAAETAKIHWRKLFAQKLSPKIKFHAFQHLANGVNFILILFSALISIPLAFLLPFSPLAQTMMNYGAVMLLGLITLALFYSPGYSYQKNRQSTFLVEYVHFLLLNIGMTYHNARAAFHGFMGKKTAFVRTPKVPKGMLDLGKEYLGELKDATFAAEVVLCCMFSFSSITALFLGNYFFLPYHLLLTLSFGKVVYYGLVFRVENQFSFSKNNEITHKKKPVSMEKTG